MRPIVDGIPAALTALALLTSCSSGGGTVFEGEGSEGRNDDSDSDGEENNDGDENDGIDPDAAETLDEIVNQDGCFSNREFMATRAWPAVLGETCLSCHGPGGIAANQNAGFVLQPSAYPGFLEVNLEALTKAAELHSNGTSQVLLKPLGQLEHGGGAALLEDSNAYAVLEEMVERVLSDDQCEDELTAAHFDDVEMLDAAATFRKAALILNGRLPTSSEMRELREGGEDALPGAINELMTEDGFFDRLVEMFNDQWLTDRYIDNAQNLLRRESFPNVETYYESLSDEERVIARQSVAREPLELMAYIVRQERPFTEIVTADYTVLNPYTAQVYANDSMDFEDTYDAGEFREGSIYTVVDGATRKFPHAGILSSPMFLNRYPTSPTNRNRHRASVVLRELLATDILRVADRPIDPTTSVTFGNPTREEDSCKMCHVTIDPIAGAFQKFDDNDYERYRPEREWFQEMYAPGYGDDRMTLDDYDDALQWLGKRIARDQRFPLSVVRNLYESLIGETPLDFPENPADGSFPAWEAQNRTIRAVADAFVESDYNFKVAVREIVMSPYFRGVNTSATSNARLAELAALGTGRLLTPELLHRKIDEVFGTPWMDGNRTALLGGYRLLYGGIDSDTVTARLTVPNGMMSSIMWRMSTEVACRSAAADFARDTDDRFLFVDVDTDVVPEDELGEPIEANVERINENLVYLYDRMFGERLEVGSAEYERVFDLFLKTWREGRAKLAADSVNRDLPWECQYRRAPGASEDLPEDQRLSRDDNYVIRSWMAVLTYMLADYRFLYD